MLFNLILKKRDNDIHVSMKLKTKKLLSNLLIGFIIKDKYGQVVAGETFYVGSDTLDFNNIIWVRYHLKYLS